MFRPLRTLFVLFVAGFFSNLSVGVWFRFWLGATGMPEQNPNGRPGHVPVSDETFETARNGPVQATGVSVW